MSFFDEAKHKMEEVAGKVEHTLGGAFGDTAMEVNGEAHAEHGEALLEKDEAPHMQNADDQQQTDSASGEGSQSQPPEALAQRQEQEREMREVKRKIDEAKHAQNTAADAGEPVRRAEPTSDSGESMRRAEPTDVP